MIYIDDALRAFWEFMTTPNDMLIRRVYNVTAMSFSPEELVSEIKEYVPHLNVTYNPDSRQEIGMELCSKVYFWNVFLFLRSTHHIL